MGKFTYRYRRRIVIHFSLTYLFVFLLHLRNSLLQQTALGKESHAKHANNVVLVRPSSYLKVTSLPVKCRIPYYT